MLLVFLVVYDTDGMMYFLQELLKKGTQVLRVFIFEDFVKVTKFIDKIEYELVKLFIGFFFVHQPIES